MASAIKQYILTVLDQHGEISGIFNLGQNFIFTQNIAWLRRKLEELRTENKIEIVSGGPRGIKRIRKVNRNSPGYPRRVRK